MLQGPAYTAKIGLDKILFGLQLFLYSMSDGFFISALSFFITEDISREIGFLLLQEFVDWHCLSFICSNNPLSAGLKYAEFPGETRNLLTLKFLLLDKRNH